MFRFSEDSILNEVASILQEWTEVWHELYLQRDHGKFSQLKKLMEQLLDLRKQYTLGQLSYTQKQDLRMKIVDKIHLGSKLLELDLVARESDGQSVNTKTTSAVHIYDRVRYELLNTQWARKIKKVQAKKTREIK